MNRATERRLKAKGIDLSDLDTAKVEVTQRPCSNAACSEVEHIVYPGRYTCLGCGRVSLHGDVTVSAYLYFDDEGRPKMVFDRPRLTPENQQRLDHWTEAWTDHQITILRTLHDRGLDHVSAAIRAAVKSRG